MTARATVWLASYPKSGNTWFRAVYSAWSTGEAVDLNGLTGGSIASFRPAFDAVIGVPSSMLTADEIDRLRPVVDDYIADAATGPLLRKVHDRYTTGPGGDPIVSTAATRSALYFVRDPRDVAVSYAHHFGTTIQRSVKRLGNPGAAMVRSRDRLDHQLRQRLGSWSDHVRSWVDEAPFPVEAFRYEDFSRDPVETFGRALRAAGLEGVEDSDVAAAVELTRFDRLREAERENAFRESVAPDREFFRRGEAGAWREELPPELAARLEADHAAMMRRFGYL